MNTSLVQEDSIWLICEYAKEPMLNFLSLHRHMANSSLAGRIPPRGGIFISLSSGVILTPLPTSPLAFTMSGGALNQIPLALHNDD